MDVLTDGYALPVSGGLYPPPPYLYRGATAIIASYEADPAAIAGLLPPGVSPLEDPPVCLAWVVHYPFSTLDVYNEAIMPRYVEMGARFILSGQDAQFLMAGAAQNAHQDVARLVSATGVAVHVLKQIVGDLDLDLGHLARVSRGFG